MNELTETEKAYLAGFIDGEGCISIMEEFHKNGKSPSFNLVLSINQCNLQILQYWKDKTGIGRIYVYKSNNPKHRDLVYWQSRNQETINLLTLIRPYMILKIDQVDLAIEYWQSDYHNYRRLGKIFRMPEYIIKKRRWYKEMMQAMKRKSSVEDILPEDAPIEINNPQLSMF